MDTSYLMEQLARLDEQINALPRGSISTKKVNGHTYFYHRWYEEKVKKERFIPEDELEQLRAQIERRKELQAQRKELKKQLPKAPMKALHEDNTEYVTIVRRGFELRAFMTPALNYRRRECYARLRDYVFGPQQDKVFVIYGLRRTGKTTMIRQILADMDVKMLNQTAFIQITAKNTLADVNKDLRTLEKNGYRYVFLDEVTLMEDFIDGAAVFSDVFAASGMKIVLSGTDSLGFLFTEDEQLYDRCIMLHTTFIPYREFEQVLGIKGIDEYIRYGGTMSMSGVNYNEDSPFANSENAREYVDTAIAHNIQHSLRYYQDGGHFRLLQELYEHTNLTSAINRIVEDINHHFTLEVLTRDFRSGDLELSWKNLRRDRAQPTDVLDQIDLAAVTERLLSMLEIRNLPEQAVELRDAQVAEIREYLALLDLTHDVGVFALPSAEKLRDRTIITLPGLRFAQADALINSLLQDQPMSDLSIMERNYVLDRTRSHITGRMMEDIVLLETALARPKKQVFVLQFTIGEYDMVVFDPAAASCEIYEVKHSTEITPEQYRHLIAPEKCAMTEHRYGSITGKYVLYYGETRDVDGIRYVNVEEYLKSL